LLVESKIVVELKVVAAITPIHKAQVINYLKASNIDVGLLINFGKARLEYYRLDKPIILPSISPKQPTNKIE
jgi:GxxExxY protein